VGLAAALAGVAAVDLVVDSEGVPAIGAVLAGAVDSMAGAPVVVGNSPTFILNMTFFLMHCFVPLQIP
jgi:hypothetical protein